MQTNIALRAYIEGRLKLPQGRFHGKAFDLHKWQSRFINGAFKPGVSDASLSLGRGGGKSTLVGAIASACVDVDGPLVEENAESLVIASSFSQGLLVFRHVLRFLEPSFERYGAGGRGRFRVQDSANLATVTDRESGAMLRVLGSDPKRLHGAAPKILILDELAQWPHGQIDAMLAALETSRGKIPDSRMISIGTRAASPSHPFERMLRGGSDYSQIHAARPNDPPFHRTTIKRANPGLDHLPDLEDAIRREAKRAKIDPASLASYRALRLNQGVSDVGVSVLVEADVWAKAEGEAPREGKPIFGVDLGSNNAQSAVAAYFPASGRLEAIAAFPMEPDLQSRGIADGVGRLYSECHRRGELITAGQHVSDIRILLETALERFGIPSDIVCDTWREADLRECLQSMGFPLAKLDLRRQGFFDGGEDTRGFSKLILTGKVTPVPSLLLSSAVSEARLVVDAAGNRKLAKNMEGGRRMRAKDDACAAAILAVDKAAREPQQRPQRLSFGLA